ncbi:peptidoglycan recognition protein family protein [Calidifontibacillus erzurumensis]|uniref:Autolysin n=1 Tax=Calidifontibacillus erzurumensis TaxID=2741433 RepID=A0A8J8KAL1_9BACI|nr:peptidoglycan recognition family protein [Calidifontibacillus erzurumensis]NSL50949.1 LysM peptidoglycan-binding domain-containing protein [Calidifontibacillus erzurumensis]
MKNIFILFFLYLVSINFNVVQAEASDSTNLYSVQAGDTLVKIAKKFNTTVKELKIANGLQTNSLFVGQKLWVPIIYQVKAGDTLDNIASAYHSTVELIKAANNLSTNILYEGQKLKIPPKKMLIKGNHILMTKEEFKEWLSHHKFKRKIRLIQQHHTWTPSYKHFNGTNHFALLKGMENFHVKEKGWKMIAQNITTFPDGKIAVSRPFDIPPEGSIGWKANHAGIMIENIGNFDKGFDVMTKEQKETIVYITALLCLKFGLTPSIDTITYHHWWDLRTGERVLDNGKSFAVKTCPGTAFFGGNTTKSATKYFYPLVKDQIKKIMNEQ